jgi:osmotically-inducible protein OsmY
MRSRAQSKRGATLVEMALVITTLLIMILFVLDMGRVLLLGQYVTARASETARAAAMKNWTADQVKNYLVYDRPDPPEGGFPASGLMGLTKSQVSYSLLGTAKKPDYRVHVEVSNIQAAMFTPFLSSRYSFPKVVTEFPAMSLGGTN